MSRTAMLRIFPALVVATVTAAVPVAANDSTAQLATGGLVFVRNDDVEMRSEELAISTQQVSVRYRFFNKSDRDVTVLVAFPMPEIRIDGAGDNIAIPSDDPVNILQFSTIADGRTISTQVEQRVYAAGLDRTAMLRELGIPLAPHLEATRAALDALPREKWDDLIRIGVAEIETFDVGQGMKDHLAARWALQTTFYWEQTFRAKAETAIEHRYRPSVGGSVQTSLGSPSAAKEAWYEDYKQNYCLDREFMSAIERARREAKSQYGAPYSEERIEYILKTGANWAGPIKDFRLVVDKGEASNLVTFCGKGIRKIGATQFEMRRTDFTPDKDLHVLILKRLPR